MTPTKFTSLLVKSENSETATVELDATTTIKKDLTLEAGISLAEMPTSALNKVTTIAASGESFALSAAQKTLGVATSMSAGSKVLTLGLAEGQTMFVKNVGATNAFSVKNIAADDTGAFSLGVGETALVCGGSATKNTFTYIILYATPAG